jgi:hypothetical protein
MSDTEVVREIDHERSRSTNSDREYQEKCYEKYN